MVVDHLDRDPATGRAREGAGDGRVERRPGGLVDVGAEGALELVVRVVGAEEVSVADEELGIVIRGVDEPAGDVVGGVAADDAGRGVVDVEAVDLDLQLAVPCPTGRAVDAGRRADVDVGLTRS